MAKKIKQPELPVETRAEITTAGPGSSEKAPVDLLDDSPDQVKADLRKYNRAEAKVRASVTTLDAITAIACADDVASAQLAMKEASAVESALDKKRLELSKPYRDQVDRINNYAKELIKPIAPAIARIKGLILAYDKAQQKKAQDLRTMVRISHLGEIGYTHQPNGGTTYYVDELGQTISIRSIEDYPDEAWSNLLQTHFDVKMAKKEEKKQQLQQELQGAEFFGDEQGSKAIQEQIATLHSDATPISMAPTIATTKTQGLTKRWVFEVTDAALIPRAYLVPDEKLIRQAVSDGARSIPGVRIYQEESISIR